MQDCLRRLGESRWDELFADLEGQLEDGIGREEREEQAEEVRLQVGRAALRDRIRSIATVREPIRFRLADASLVDLAPRTTGRDWLSGDLAGDEQAVLPLAAVVSVLPTREQLERSRVPAPAEGALTDRLGLAFVLRDLARRRRAVHLTTRAGVVTGTLDRVGRDHLDVAVHPADAWRRASAVSRIELVPLAELLLVRVG